MEASRRKLLKAGLVGSVLSSTGLARASTLHPTPSEIEGPFYPVIQQKDKDFDLTRVMGETEAASGEVVYIEGTVCDISGEVIEDASVDLWQANAVGRYRHPHDSNPAPLDPYFQGWAIVPSGVNGGFKFKTIMPGAYPAARNWMRPPHIHFKVSKKGFIELVTQMYFPGHELNEIDLLIKRKSTDEQKQMIATRISDEPATFRYQIVLQKI